MPYTLGKRRLFYKIEGDGSLVILLHGLLMSGDTWNESGLIQKLSKKFRVAYPDLLGHGLSDKPSECENYTINQQADLIINLIDSLGYKKAHIVGYSSGAWLAIGIAQLYPDRLGSLVVGGWDSVNGLPEGPGGKLTFDIFMAFAQESAPLLASSINSKSKAGLCCFFNTLRDHHSMSDVISELTIPVIFWAGVKDPYYIPMRDLANKYGLCFIGGTGDHISEMLKPDNSVIEEINEFLEKSEAELY